MNKTEQVFQRVLEEVNQGHSLRQPAYVALEQALGGDKCVISLFTSFRFPVLLDDTDADMLEELLTNTSMDGKRLVLILSSPGGDTLAAERIVKICRSFSPQGYCVIVPKMAKSAATVVCLGADEIIMSETSELGPIDPQILIFDEHQHPLRYQAAHEILDSYNQLMDNANKTKGNPDPYLQQLARFDARDIRSIKSAQNLTEHVAINLLKAGIMRKQSEKKIKQNIRLLIDPEATKDHGRPVFHDGAIRCGLNVVVKKNTDPVWHKVWEIYIRLNHLTRTICAKVAESKDEHYVMPTPKEIVGN